MSMMPENRTPAKGGDGPDVLDLGRPAPLQAVVVTARGRDGAWTEVVRRWRTDDALACRRCPRSLCTASPGEDGQAICVLRFSGLVEDDDAADVGLPTAPAARPASTTPTLPFPPRGGFGPA